jgi:hypothetical protein
MKTEIQPRLTAFETNGKARDPGLPISHENGMIQIQRAGPSASTAAGVDGVKLKPGRNNEPGEVDQPVRRSARLHMQARSEREGGIRQQRGGA